MLVSKVYFVFQKSQTFAAAYKVNHVKTPSTLSNQYVVCEAKKKFNTLVDVVMTRKTEKILIFFATCACVDYFGRALKGDIQICFTVRG